MKKQITIFILAHLGVFQVGAITLDQFKKNLEIPPFKKQPQKELLTAVQLRGTELIKSQPIGKNQEKDSQAEADRQLGESIFSQTKRDDLFCVLGVGCCFLPQSMVCIMRLRAADFLPWGE